MLNAFTGYVDLAQVTLYVFWAFFFSLIYYLHRENKREGYPLVSEIPGHTEEVATHGYFMRAPEPKRFLLWEGGEAFAPPSTRPRFPVNARPSGPFPGSPLEPTGNPLVDGIGPASWCHREDKPDRTIDGELKIVPMRDAAHYYVHRRSPQPKGMAVIGADGVRVGIVLDLWVDEIEEALRYLEVDLDPEIEPDVLRTRILVPMHFVRFRSRLAQVSVRALLAHQFRDVPRLRDPDQVTRLEEEKLVAYFGGGSLYATPGRLGPLL